MDKIFIKHDDDGFYILLNSLCRDNDIAEYLNITLRQYVQYGNKYNGKKKFLGLNFRNGLSFNNYEDIINFKGFIETLLVAKTLEGDYE